MINPKDWYTEATDIRNNGDGTISGYISSLGDSFPFTAKIGEWAEVEWLDPDDHKHKAQGHRIAATYATRKFVTEYKKSLKRRGII